MKKTKAIAIFGTGSDVGKSIVAAALCRSLADRGIRVAPFKAQNMSNNSGITAEGLEMGRAQIVQAEAAGIAPHVDMNPVLLKPTGEKGSQVVLNGKAFKNCTAMDYYDKKKSLFNEVCKAYDRLSARFDLIVLEGAGSCAEVNLMPLDIVNFRMAEYAEADVILVADIHRGGVFGQIVGTLECIPEKYRNMIKGFIINRFRGDISLFKDGVDWIEKKTGKDVFGVLPWYNHFRIDAEDSVEIENCQKISSSIDKSKPAIGVVKLPHISNFTDFHALSKIKDLQLMFIENPADFFRFRDMFNAIILPGSKNTRMDILWLKKTGWDKIIKQYAESPDGHVLGICGGFQMLGEYVDDPEGTEDKPGRTKGLGLLPVKTVIQSPKTTTLSSFSWNGKRGEGYEIHMGFTEPVTTEPVTTEPVTTEPVTTEPDKGSALFKVNARNGEKCNDHDGCITEDKKIAGTYMHGMFDSDEIRSAWLELVGIKSPASGISMDKKDSTTGISGKDRDYALLKEHFEKHIDLNKIIKNTGITVNSGN